MPNFKMGHIEEVKHEQIGNFHLPYRNIIHGDGLIRVEYYTDSDPSNPIAYSMFLERLSRLHNELQNWATIVCDPVTGMYLTARKLEEKILNPTAKDKRQWYGGGVDTLEEIICIQMIGFIHQNVIVITHIDERKNEVSGEILRGPLAPGRLGQKRGINTYYQEQYHAFTQRDMEGNIEYLMQTVNDGEWACSSLVHAPNPLFPHYESMWENWTVETRPKVKSLIYGDFGTGKSSFAQTFPKPMLVFSFDGKDLPYWQSIEY